MNYNEKSSEKLEPTLAINIKALKTLNHLGP
jgi:hypothetical protein